MMMTYNTKDNRLIFVIVIGEPSRTAECLVCTEYYERLGEISFPS